MNQAYIALGSNIEPRLEYLQLAIQRLKEHRSIQIKKVSGIYETAPVGFTDQNDFLNMAIRIETTLSPLELLDTCQEIEHSLGRKREIKWGPRTIDLDILLYNQENIETERLTLPHPSMHERAFVLMPLMDINHHLYLSHIEKDVSTLISEMSLKEKEGVVQCNKIDGGKE
ncbi:2-amino-4-hydroxy-6-hydroxymethyldihydropteridine diphosphokinase [Gracilibacillus dipsosauri]|uniref:2-amino-4-hydroxy-6-hydroxymethyldihydropteridine diphosphokinase n=1 Tax=Gracilibacillus dipsosauri TaxID=178340 RepID=A0A317KWY6_9BACI|nr:2-amino-4-hydroxy-6-hydroxymethyldihydropteridine diphosphokinase [Gracilibacillus dipsosauri]PWU67806.1 2-amino-4-hydroxy-6-hydroxymethyldihydropteridine diphosphokinase [Gracilibacillus dipsosauri]